MPFDNTQTLLQSDILAQASGTVALPITYLGIRYGGSAFPMSGVIFTTPQGWTYESQQVGDNIEFTLDTNPNSAANGPTTEIWSLGWVWVEYQDANGQVRLHRWLPYVDWQRDATAPETINVTFGADTLQGAGGYIAPAGATSIASAPPGYSLVGGYVVASADASPTPGVITFNGTATAMAVSIEVDCYSVRSNAEARAAVLSDPSGGYKVCFRGPDAGTAGIGDINLSGGAWHNLFNGFTSEVEFTSSDVADKAIIGEWVVFSTGTNRPRNFAFTDLIFRKDYTTRWTGSGSALATFINIQQTGAGRNGRGQNVRIERNEFDWQLPDYTPSYPTHFPGPTDQWEYSAIDSTIGIDGLIVSDNECHNCVNFILFMSGSNVVIDSNNMHHCWADFLRYGPGQDGLNGILTPTTNWQITNNDFKQPTGNYRWRHADFAQSFMGSAAPGNADVSDIVVRGNRVWLGEVGLATDDEPGVDTPAATQFMLMQRIGANNTGIYRNFLIEANIHVSDVVHFVTSEIEIADSIVRCNSAILGRERFIKDGWLQGGNRPGIRLQATNCEVYQNFAADVVLNYQGFATTGSFAADNVVIPLNNNDLTGYQSLFAGTDFIPDATPADLLAEFAMLPNGGLDQDGSGTDSQGDAGAIGITPSSGYFDWVTRTTDPSKLNTYP